MKKHISFTWFDPVNNDPHFIRLISNILQTKSISFVSFLLPRQGWDAGHSLNFLPDSVSKLLQSGKLFGKCVVAALYIPAMIRAILLLPRMPRPILVSSAIWFPAIDGLFLGLLRWLGVKPMILVHRPYSLQTHAPWAARMYFSPHNCYLALSDFTGEYLLREYNIPAENISVLPIPNYNLYLDGDAPDIVIENQLREIKKSGKRIVLCCSGISKGHGALVLIDIIEAARRKCSNLFFMIMGRASGNEGGKVFNLLAQRLGAAENVVIREGFYTNAQIKAALLSSDVALLPYRDIAQSAVLAMALGQGLPAIVSGAGGMSELINDGYNGRVVRDWCVESWLTALIQSDFLWTRNQIRENSERVHGSLPTCEFFREWLSKGCVTV